LPKSQRRGDLLAPCGNLHCATLAGTWRLRWRSPLADFVSPEAQEDPGSGEKWINDEKNIGKNDDIMLYELYVKINPMMLNISENI